MAVEYYIVELNDDFSSDESVTAKIAEAFSLDPRKAKLLLSKAPGAITKPIILAEAELVAARFRRAGLKVIIKKTANDEDSPLNNNNTERPQSMPKHISLPDRNLLSSTMIQEPARLATNKAQIKLRLLAAGLAASLALIALALFFFLINSGTSGLSQESPWQRYGPLILAALFALTVSLPILYKSYKSFQKLG